MISGPSTYLETIDDFLAHWASVNADPLAGTGLVTGDGKTRADLAALRTSLNTATDAVANTLTDKEIARALIENDKKHLLDRAQELGRRLRGVLPHDSHYLDAIPEMPQQSSAEGIFLQPIREIANVWRRVDGSGVHFTLAGDFALADYTALLAAIIGDYGDLSTAENDLNIERSARNKLQDKVKELLSGYRPAVEGLFPPDSPLVDTIPVIYAPSTGTPKPVHANAVYDAATNEAVVNVTGNIDPAVTHLELRGVAGPEYFNDDETLLATIPADGLREFRTGYALAHPGMAVSLKVVGITATGHYSGSEVMTVTRPS